MNQQPSHGLVGAYAADALDDTERSVFEAHLETCADCRAEVASLREGTATLAEATATAPPPELRDRIMAQISAVRPLPPVAPTTPDHRAPDHVDAGPTEDREVAGTDELATRRERRAGGRRRLTSVIGVAAAAAVLAVGLGVTQPWADDLSPSEQVLQADDALETSVDLGGGATATVVHSDSVGQSVLQTEDMPPAPEGSVYQLWYAEDGEFVPAGLMPVEAGDQTVSLEGDSREASGVGITVEPAGGSEAPSAEPIAMFDFGPGA